MKLNAKVMKREGSSRPIGDRQLCCIGTGVQATGSVVGRLLQFLKNPMLGYREYCTLISLAMRAAFPISIPKSQKQRSLIP